MAKEKFTRKNPTRNIGEIVEEKVVITPQSLATTRAAFTLVLENEISESKDTKHSETPKTFIKK